MSRSERIAQQLGMSHGAAAGKLKKNILFSLLVRLQENVCFKCDEQIFSANDLSIEHKQPWEGRDANLFWDLNNIAFSHLRCNTPHTFPCGERQKKETLERPVPVGTAWCSKHKKFLPVEKFAKRSSRWNGLRHACVDCEKDYKDFMRQKRQSSSSSSSCGDSVSTGRLTESGNVLAR